MVNDRLWILTCALLVSCGGASFRVLKKAPPKPKRCEIEVFGTETSAREAGKIEELCAFSSSAGTTVTNSNDLLEAEFGQLCRCGADAVYIQQAYDPAWPGKASVRGVGFRFLERRQMVTHEAPLSNEELSRLPGEVTMLPLRGGAESGALAIEELIATYMGGPKSPVKLLTSSELEAKISVEKWKDLLGCSTESCVVSSSSFLPEQLDGVFYGSVAPLGQNQIVTLAYIDLNTRQEIARNTIQVNSSAANPFDAVTFLCRGLLRQIAAAEPSTRVARDSAPETEQTETQTSVRECPVNLGVNVTKNGSRFVVDKSGDNKFGITDGDRLLTIAGRPVTDDYSAPILPDSATVVIVVERAGEVLSLEGTNSCGMSM